MKNLLASTALMGALCFGAVSADASPPFTLGIMAGGPEYQQTIDTIGQFSSLMGSAPLVYNVYMNLSVTPDQWVGGAGYDAGLISGKAPWNAGCSTGKCTYIPMIGLPITTTAYSNQQNDQLLQAVAAGQYNGQIQGYEHAFANAGWKTQYWRPGVEMNYGSTPGDIQGSQDADWIAAFRVYYTQLHAAAAADGVNLKVIWNAGSSGAQPQGNPTSGLGSSPPGVGFWPGAAYVDVVAVDLYSDLNPQGGSNPYDWAANGQKYGGSIYDSSLAQFASNPINLEHYYSFPSSNGSGQDASCPNNGQGYAPGANCGGSFSLLNAIVWAKSQGKPIALPETSTDADHGGPTTNPTFPLWLASMLSYGVSQGVPVTVASVWDDNSGCTCGFTPTTADGSTATAAGWGASFGVNAPANPPNRAAIIEVGTNTPVKPVGPPHAMSPAGTAVHGTTGTIYDTSGDAWTITTDQLIAMNGTPVPVSAGVVALYWTGTALDQLNNKGAWYTQPLDGGTGVSTMAPAGYVAAATPITITPATETVKTTEGASAEPFKGMAITDAKAGQTETAKVTLSSAASGTLSDPKSSTDRSTIASGVLTVSGSATAVATDLDGLVFKPSSSTSTVTTTVTAQIKDTAGETASAKSTITPTHAASLAGTQVKGTAGTIYDTSGNAWTITTGQLIAMNGTPVPVSAGVVALYWTGTALDQLNNKGAWYTQPLDGGTGVSTTAPAGKATHAVSPAGIAVHGTTGTIYDTSGNAWTITSAKTIAENGTPIPVSSDVVTLFWSGTALFQLNTSGHWWTQPLTGAEGTELAAAPAGYVVP